MNDDNLPDPTPEERAQADRAIREFMAEQAAIPESERVLITSPKFDGPVGQPLDDASANPPGYQKDALDDQNQSKSS